MCIYVNRLCVCVGRRPDNSMTRQFKHPENSAYMSLESGKSTINKPPKSSSKRGENVGNVNISALRSVGAQERRKRCVLSLKMLLESLGKCIAFGEMSKLLIH